MMMMIHDDDDDGDDDDDDDNVKKQVVFWNHDDTFSHATLAKSSFRYSGVLIFCPYNVHFLHGREKVGNQVVTKFHGHPSIKNIEKQPVFDRKCPRVLCTTFREKAGNIFMNLVGWIPKMYCGLSPKPSSHQQDDIIVFGLGILIISFATITSYFV